MESLEQQIKDSFEAALYFGRQFNEWKEEQKLDLEQPSKELLTQVIKNWSDRVELLKIPRKQKRFKQLNTKRYIDAQQEFLVGAMGVIQMFYPKANFTGWIIIIQSERDILDFYL